MGEGVTWVQGGTTKVSESARKIKYLATPRGQEYLKRKRGRSLPALLKWAKGVTPAQRYAWRRLRHAEKKQQALDLLGHKCVRCGFDDARALQVDHVTPVGKNHPDRKYGERFWKRIIDHPEQFQRLCANCNVIKSFENGERG